MSYTPTNWNTGDVVTAEKLNKMESGIADVSKISPDSDPYLTGQILRYLDGSGMVADSINSVVEPFAYYFDIDVDENLNFTTDITRQTLAWGKWANGISIYANVAGYHFPLYAAPFSSDALFYGPSFQTNIIALDDIGLTNYVGYLSLFPDYDGAGYIVTLVKWLLGGVGGGVFAVHDDHGTLDKTWQEIYDAMTEGSQVIITRTLQSEGNYSVFSRLIISAEYDEAGLPPYSVWTDQSPYRVDSANGYPILEDSSINEPIS